MNRTQCSLIEFRHQWFPDSLDIDIGVNDNRDKDL